MDYIPVNEQEKGEMLSTIGVKSSDELFTSVPEAARKRPLELPVGVSEHALVRSFENLSKKNRSLKDLISFRGAGVYDHFVPAMVEEITGRSEFFTAYTPYQAEASQGTLQAVFEYQSMIVELTGLDVSNASLYDGASATAEAALLAFRATGRTKLIISKAVHPEYRETVRTYLQGFPCEIIEAPIEDGFTSLSDLRSLVTPETAAVVIQSPNFLGTVEDLAEIKSMLKESGTLLVAVMNPLSLGILASPGEVGADIAVGEGQVLGNATGFGGCSFGYLAAKKELSWKLPGRIVGQTVDKNGRRGFVLTLQSREQHIRRERATSNICTNAALNALAGGVYLSGWGPQGLMKLGEANLQKSHYAFEQLTADRAFSPAFRDQQFFNEFVLKTTKDIAKLEKKLLAAGILGPIELARFYPEYKNCLLFCVTEARTKEEIDRMVAACIES